MSNHTIADDNVEVTVENVGGITETTIEFPSGVTILAGRNATNRTSFLRALMGALGSDEASLKSDANTGKVELSIGDERFTRRYQRNDGKIITDGEPYLSDATLGELFAFLLETNEARRAVATGADLRELLLRPIDTDAIEAAIERLQDEKRAIRDKLAELDTLEQEKTRLKREQAELQQELEETRATRKDKAAEVGAFDHSVEETQSEKEALDSKLQQLHQVQGDLESTRYQLESERESVEELRTEKAAIQADHESVADHAVPEAEEIETRLEQLREEQQELNTLVTDLQRIVRFNEEMLAGSESKIREKLSEAETNLTDTLLDDEKLVCWTCGKEVGAAHIENTINELRELRVNSSERRGELQSRIDDLSERKRTLDEERRQRKNTEDRLEQLSSEIERREAAIQRHSEQRDRLTDRVAELESDVESLDVLDEYEELLAAHRELNELDFTIEQLAEKLSGLEETEERIDRQLGERSALAEALEEVEQQLRSRREEVAQIEQQAVNHFNEHMDQVLQILEYVNLSRIWIERITDSSRETATFELHVVRTDDAEAAYEDSIHHLSESEREVTGLVFALAGYLAHDVHEELPFILLDSLEAVDSDRIAKLIEYLENYAESLVVALLPEDAAGLNGEYTFIEEI